MEKEIKDIIEKNLPAQVGEVLNKRLQEADFYEKKCQNMQHDVIVKDSEIKELRQNLEEYRKLDERNKLLDGREIACSQKEVKQEIEALKVKLSAEESKTKFSQDVALGLVRNTNYRKSIFDSENQSGYTGQNGNWIQPTPINKSLDENKSAE